MSKLCVRCHRISTFAKDHPDGLCYGCLSDRLAKIYLTGGLLGIIGFVFIVLILCGVLS